MTHNEFTDILGGIHALSPEQMRQLRRELDSRLAADTSPSAGQEPAAAEREEAATPTTGQESPPTSHKPIWEEILEISASVPDEAWDDLPTDLSAQHDHYIYGTPKRTDA